MGNEESDLGGQVAIVTGGGRGIGQAIALSLARAGASVAIVARTKRQIEQTVGAIASAGELAIAVAADVTDQHAVEHMVAHVGQQGGIPE